MKRTSSYLSLAAVVLLLGAFASSCTTKKNTRVTRGYHNMTSRYNGYFYARESMKDARDKIDKAYIDDYSELLPIFRLPVTPETKGSFSDYEKAIKKSTSVIERHAITKKDGEEIAGAVKWIDDSYLIIGQARYYKGEYLSAMEVFTYITQKYSKFPIRFDGFLWQAKAHIALGAYTEAESLLDLVANDKACPPALLPEIKATYADLYMHTGNYGNAIKFLTEAIEITKGKKTRARYTYILAQLYEKTGEEKKALKQYSDVVEMNPPYEMLFNARISRARLSGSSSKNRQEAKKELEKMLNDDKNNEYQDQIYYTLGQLEAASGDMDGARIFYKKSIAASAGNAKQKALTYLALGDLYFAETDYLNAQAYYDSTMQFLPKDYASYSVIDEKRTSLSTLVRHIKTVNLEDSLQGIAKKYGSDTTALYAFIDKLIEKKKEEERKKKEELENAMQSGSGGPVGPMQPGGSPGGGPGGNPGGLWYFYNQSTISFGISEFTRKWGNRKLEDNWRRNNKESYIIEDGGSGDPGNPQASVGKPGKNDKLGRDFYLKPLPLKPEDLKKSDEKIAEALYNLGSIYKEQLRNNTRATEAFESLCARYPDHKYALPSHFQLYRLYQSMNNTAKSDEHKNYILNKHPQSEYAELIRNPNFEVSKLAQKEKVNKYYEDTYLMYTGGNYTAAISRCEYADTAFGRKNEHAAQFAYIRAVSIGKTQGTPAMEKALTNLVASYPKDPVKDQAQALLDAIRRQRGDVVAADTAKAAPEYTVDANAEHNYMVIVNRGKGNINNFKIAISDFNSQNFASNNYTISSIVLDNQREVILVKGFKNKTEAMSYFSLLKSRLDLFSELTPGSYQVFTISKDNYTLFYRSKVTQFYKDFFDKNYINNTK
ncbi:MAG: tetratricopeptide repeat protein [Bacteroidota bacterium]